MGNERLANPHTLGEWSIDPHQCLNVQICMGLAHRQLKQVDFNGSEVTTVAQQPETLAQQRSMARAAIACPSGSIGRLVNGKPEDSFSHALDELAYGHREQTIRPPRPQRQTTKSHHPQP